MRRPSLDLAEPARNIEESVGSPSTELPNPDIDFSIPQPEASADLANLADYGDRIHAPPPHIVARLFYPPTNQTRRKESAASSRRNSISSIQSRSSQGCGLSSVGPQSKYIAQHLRRASILEDRKARLADRAAHAEKVRLRAALAKSAPKDTSASEERALAAAQARERNLAEIAASCAEEVKRAKAVAESMKEKREQALRKMKLQMEERHAEAERRREGLRNRNTAKIRPRERGQSLLERKRIMVEVLPEVKETKEQEVIPLQPDVAATRIQCWWMAMARKQSVKTFSELGLSIEGVQNTSFEKVIELLSQENVLRATARVLRICGLREGEAGSVNEMAAVRTFLSVFMLLGHPSQVLSNKDGTGAQEKELVAKARDLLISFENILSRLTLANNYTSPPALFQSLPEVYATFYNAFVAWKARDSSSLIELMVMQFVELDMILQTVKESRDGSVDEVYKQSIQDNQVMLLVRIKKLAGAVQGKKTISDAVRKARKERAEKRKTAGDSRPRIAEHTHESVTADQNGNVGFSAATQTCTPPPMSARSSREGVPVINFGPLSGLIPDNRFVVHELAINKEFRIEPNEYREQKGYLFAPLFAEMRATIQADNQEGHFLLLLAIAREIRDRLQRLVRPDSPMYVFIAELLDTDVAKRQFTSGSFSYEKFFQSMSSLLGKLCAPVRDGELKHLIEIKLTQGHYVDRLEALVGFIDVMMSDYANYLLHVVAPVVIESAVPYETKAFAKLMEGGVYDLSMATKVWRAARQKVVAEAARRDPDGMNHPRSRVTPNRVYNEMLVDLFTQVSDISLERMPAMLLADHKRALKAGRLTRKIVVAGAILVQCKNILKRDVRTPWKNESQRIMFVLDKFEAEPTLFSGQDAIADAIMVALEAGRSMPVATKKHIRALVAKFTAAGAEMAESSTTGTEPREPVVRLLLNRLRGHLLARLGAASASDKVKATSTAAEKLAGLGLAEFVDRVSDMVDVLSRVGTVDRDTHSAWWDLVAEMVDAEDGQDRQAFASASTAGAA